jgi:Alpha-glutamyl/putrescinyl thymine pyrophosphorylase clade 2/Glutamine amidotransferase domain
MCGIVGIQFLSNRRQPKAKEFVEQLFLESKIRGCHASGVAFVDAGQINAYKQPLPANEFIKTAEWKSLNATLPQTVLLHTRYSTSGVCTDSRNNQPLATRSLALAHNGIISMAEQDQFAISYNVQTQSANDSEIVLRKLLRHMNAGESVPEAIRGAITEIAVVETPIFACGLLLQNTDLYCFRDNVRPLYRFRVPELNLLGFCSTRDIFERGVASCGLHSPACEVELCEPYVIYRIGTDEKWEMGIRYTSPRTFPRPAGLVSGVDKKLLRNEIVAQDARVDLPPNPGIDFRQARREGFMLYYAAQVLSDIDPGFPTLNEIFGRYELSLEQQFWCAFLYATFYHNATVFLVLQEFPELHKIDIDRLERWHVANWRLLLYQGDRRWNKGHFVEMVKSYREVVGNQTQEEFFSKLLVTRDPVASFNNCWIALHKVFKMGRHSVYAWTEALIRCLGLPLECPSFYMDIAESSRNGLCNAIGRDDLVTHHDKKFSDGARISKTEIKYLEEELEHLMADIRHRYPNVPVDYMYLETACCAYKGMHRRRRYLGYYLDRMASEIRRGEKDMASISPGVDWGTLWQIRTDVFIHEYLGERQNPPWFEIRPELNGVFMDAGYIVNTGPLRKRGLLASSACLD